MIPAAAVLVAGAAGVLLAGSDRPARFGQPGARWRPGSWPTGRGAVLAAAAGAAVAGAWAGPVASVLAGAAAAVAVHRWQHSRAVAQRVRRRAAEVELLAALVAELRAGRQAQSALSAVQAVADASLGDALAAARAAAATGGDVGAALRSGTEPDVTRDGHSTLHRLAAAWQVSAVAGAPLAEVVERVQAELRAVTDLQAKAEVELAGARATGGLLALLPVLGVVLGQAMGARPLHVLLDTPVGAICSACGLALELAGLSWVGRLTGGAGGRTP